MINAEKIFNNNIKKPLSEMNGVFYVDGWVKVYLDDLKRNTRSTSVQNVKRPKFPIVAAHVVEDVFAAFNLEQFTVRRQIVISGAIDVKNKEDIDARLQTLYRNAISVIIKTLDPVIDKSKLTLNNSKFSIPDDDSEYAMFELIITTNTSEDIYKWVT